VADRSRVHFYHFTSLWIMKVFLSIVFILSLFFCSMFFHYMFFRSIVLCSMFYHSMLFWSMFFCWMFFGSMFFRSVFEISFQSSFDHWPQTPFAWKSQFGVRKVIWVFSLEQICQGNASLITRSLTHSQYSLQKCSLPISYLLWLMSLRLSLSNLFSIFIQTFWSNFFFRPVIIFFL